MVYISRYKILNETLENNKNCILITERSIYTIIYKHITLN